MFAFYFLLYFLFVIIFGEICQKKNDNRAVTDLLCFRELALFCTEFDRRVVVGTDHIVDTCVPAIGLLTCCIGRKISVYWWSLFWGVSLHVRAAPHVQPADVSCLYRQGNRLGWLFRVSWPGSRAMLFDEGEDALIVRELLRLEVVRCR